MGIINQGILGGFSGKVGPIVGFRWKSNYYIRARATAFNFLKTMKPFIRMGYKEFTQDKSAFNAAMSYTLKRAVTGSGRDITIDFNRALVSMGTLMPVFEGTAMQERDKMSFNWQNNSGTGNAEDTDIAMLLVYNKDKEMAVYDTGPHYVPASMQNSLSRIVGRMMNWLPISVFAMPMETVWPIAFVYRFQ